MNTARLKCLAARFAVLIAVCVVGSAVGCGDFTIDLDLFRPGDGADTGDGAEPDAPSGMEVVSIPNLPPEARTTLQLIESNGPYPYAKDGTVFHNYEGLLPRKADGYYREYTVVTPGASDRGARRIVAGKDAERYYTDDHYNSFRLVLG